MTQDRELAKEFYRKGLVLIHEYDFEGENPRKLQKAEKLFQKALEVYPSLFEAKVGIANCKLKRRSGNDLDEAEVILREVSELEPTDPYIHLNLGRCLQMRGSLDEGVREMEIAVKLKPDLYTAHWDLGRYYMKKGDEEGIEDFYPKAREHLQQATKSEFSEFVTQATDLLKQIDDALGSG